MGHQFTVEEKKKEAYFVRIPKDMYQAIQEAAEENDRTIQLQSQILLGAALNRDLVNPGQMVYEKTEETETDVIAELHRQIEFLQNVVDSFAKGNKTTLTYTPTSPLYIPYWRPSPYIVWSGDSGKVGGSVAKGGFENQSGPVSFSIDTSKLLG